ncbi:MAG: anaerobic ribonucleoside-triphosphate reductase [Aeromonas jandaei]
MKKEISKIDTKIFKKNGILQPFDGSKIIKAIEKSAKRADVKLSDNDKIRVLNLVINKVKGIDVVHVSDIHNKVELALDDVNMEVAKAYRNFRNWVKEERVCYDEIEESIDTMLFGKDYENSNSDTDLFSTKRTGLAQKFAKKVYIKKYLSNTKAKAIKEGQIYIHDLSDRLVRMFNCCLFDAENVLKGGFRMSNTFYNEPKDVETAINQLGDVIMSASAQQYGGFTVPHIDKTLAKYYKMTYEKTFNHLLEDLSEFGATITDDVLKKIEQKAKKRSYRKLKQSLQGLEAKLNDVVSARGSFPFTTFTIGYVNNEWEAEVAKAIFEVRVEGHGKPGFKESKIFPKLVFLYHGDLHGEGKEYEWLFLEGAVVCSSKCMYPDNLSWKKYFKEGKWVSPMGCRAFLSDWRDENGELQFIGRFNIGACSLGMPLIWMDSKVAGVDFFEELDKYLQMIREIHLMTYEQIGSMKASSNPLMFCEGGAYGGNLKPNEKIMPLLESATASFGITALNELSILATGKSIKEDNTFANSVMDHISMRVEQFKKEDNRLYAIYGTPAESLCGTQIQQFRAKYGVIEKVSDKEFFTNSFHLHVSEDITPIEKQDGEYKLFHKHNGGHIQYVRVSNPKNLKGLASVIRRGMELGYYQGVNFNACNCVDCGHEGNDFGETCPKCGSKHINEVNRICGYMGSSRRNGDTTLNSSKRAEVEVRKSM